MIRTDGFGLHRRVCRVPIKADTEIGCLGKWACIQQGVWVLYRVDGLQQITSFLGRERGY